MTSLKLERKIKLKKKINGLEFELHDQGLKG